MEIMLVAVYYLFFYLSDSTVFTTSTLEFLISSLYTDSLDSVPVIFDFYDTRIKISFVMEDWVRGSGGGCGDNPSCATRQCAIIQL